MANKVASKRWIYSNFSVGSSSNECATKTEILGFGLYITNDSSYASNQLVREEDIYLPAWTYSFSVSNWDKNVGESGGTTSSISISSSKSRLGTTESVGWSIDSSTVPSWITWNSSSMTFTVASNSSTSSRTANIYFEQDESGKRDYARVTQGAKPAENVYVFTITPNTYDVSYSNASFIPRTVSTKNGSKIGYSLTSGETDWVVVTIDSKVAVEILKNTTSSTRSTTLVFTQNESGKTQSIKITQSGQQDEYILSMWPESNTSGSYPADAQNTNIEVRSLCNGQKHQIGVKSQPLWCTAYISRSDDSGIYYIDLAIQGNSMIISREGTIVFEQEDSGKTTSYTVSQSGSIASQDNKLTITSLTYDVAYLFPPGQVPVEGDTAYLSFMIPNTFTWKTSSGLNMNRGVAYAGNICNIYVSENSRYKLVKSFKLQTGKQTVNI